MKGIEVRPEQYMAAAEERLLSGKKLAQGENCDLVDVSYHAGLAAECALLAHLAPNQALDRKHRLALLGRRTTLRFPDKAKEERFVDVLTGIDDLWENALRYYSNRRFEALCRKEALRRKRKRYKKGRYTVERTRRLLDMATEIVEECKVQWNTELKKNR